MKDLTKMREALQDAIKWREPEVKVSTSELQSVLNRLDRFQEHGEQVPKQFGYIISDDLRNMRNGTHMFAKVKRRNSGRFDCPIYFMTMPKPDPCPVPGGIYYNAEDDSFYSDFDNEGMGAAFWQNWRRRKADFPQQRMPELQRKILQDLEDCMVDLDSPEPTHFFGLTNLAEKT